MRPSSRQPCCQRRSTTSGDCRAWHELRQSTREAAIFFSRLIFVMAVLVTAIQSHGPRAPRGGKHWMPATSAGMAGVGGDGIEVDGVGELGRVAVDEGDHPLRERDLCRVFHEALLP